SVQGVGIRLCGIQPGRARRLHQTAPAVRRPRPAASARHGHGPRAGAAQRVRRPRQGPTGPVVAGMVDLGPGDSCVALRQRPGAGRFDALLNVWNTDPTPSSGFPQTWTPAGFGRSNYGRYDNPEVDRLVDQAVASAANRDQARRAWRAAVETLNRDAPGIFLFATSNVAAVHKRIADVTIRPDSWLALLRTWRIPADRLTDRDRVER